MSSVSVRRVLRRGACATAEYRSLVLGLCHDNDNLTVCTLPMWA